MEPLVSVGRRSQFGNWLLYTRMDVQKHVLLSDYPELTKDDLKAARTYYAQNPVEIDEAIAAQHSDG